MSAIVDALKADHDTLIELLVQHEPSMAQVMESTLAKVLLLATASELEAEVQRIIIDFYAETTGGHDVAISFVRNKAIERQFHTYFSWERSNANSFFGPFGAELKAHADAAVKSSADLAQAIRDFIQLGALRNQLVHQNYAMFTLSATANDIYAWYQSAFRFVDALPALLRLEQPSLTTADTSSESAPDPEPEAPSCGDAGGPGD